MIDYINKSENRSTFFLTEESQIVYGDTASQEVGLDFLNLSESDLLHRLEWGWGAR